LLVGLNAAVRTLALRGGRGFASLVGTIPALVGGAACCVPTLILMIGLQMSGDPDRRLAALRSRERGPAHWDARLVGHARGKTDDLRLSVDLRATIGLALIAAALVLGAMVLASGENRGKRRRAWPPGRLDFPATGTFIVPPALTP
jgi:hypothetical protein